jgi:hypothetical protein
VVICGGSARVRLTSARAITKMATTILKAEEALISIWLIKT